jgi:hypothetical protein
VKRPRFPIAGLMAAVAAVAVNLAVFRSFDDTANYGLAKGCFAAGVMPAASTLVVLALISGRELFRGGRLPPFVCGFEAFGWTAVFAFITCYSIAPSVLVAYIEPFYGFARRLVVPHFVGSPRWLAAFGELGFGTALCSLPQLIIAMFGGWLAQKVGLTLRFERCAMEPAVSGTVAARDPGSPHVTYRGIS